MYENLIAYGIAYILGAIPFGVIFGKIFGKINIKNAGSGGIGATNVLRVLKQENPKMAKKIAVLTFICDMLKGFLPIFIFYKLNFDINVLWMMSVLSVIGHCFSVFLKFEGGKGIATGFGSLLFLLPTAIFAGLITWIIFAKFIKISSLASLMALISVLISSHLSENLLNDINSFMPIYIIAYIIIYKHIPNIRRLIEGNEIKV